MRQMRGKPKETNKQKKERKKEFLENKNVGCGDSCTVSYKRLNDFSFAQFRYHLTKKQSERKGRSFTKPFVEKIWRNANDPEPGGSGYAIIKPTIFAVSFSSACFMGAALWQYENMRHHARTIIGAPRKKLVDKLEPSTLWIQKKFNIGGDFREKRGSVRQICNSSWNSLSEGQRVFFCILIANVSIYLAWKVPLLKPTMSRYFVSYQPSRATCWPMILSTFSHYNGLHLAANMFVLNSFVSGAVSSLGKEQFLAFYLSAGVLSSWLSLMYRVIVRDVYASLGASGAIMGILSYTCVKYPDSMLSIIFLPFLVFKAGMGIKLIMAVDFSCLVAKFRIFDHAAHLGGAIFGLFWNYWGNTYIWQKRGPLLKRWHKYRNRSY